MNRIRRLISSGIGRLTRSAAERSQLIWDGLYRCGEPDRYRSLEQCARYGVIEAYCKAPGRPVAVLEVGCGAGILVDRFDKSVFERYDGIDVSPVAIETARKRWSGGNYLVGAAEKISFPDESFDIIIFNESLYCIEDMRGQLRRYLAFLKEQGCAVISISGLRRDAQQLLELAFAANIVSQTSIADRGSCKSWVVYLLSKSPQASVMHQTMHQLSA